MTKTKYITKDDITKYWASVIAANPNYYIPPKYEETHKGYVYPERYSDDEIYKWAEEYADSTILYKIKYKDKPSNRWIRLTCITSDIKECLKLCGLGPVHDPLNREYVILSGRKVSKIKLRDFANAVKQ